MSDEKHWTQHRYEERLARVADGLRRLADAVERDGRLRDAGDDILWRAQTVIHDVTWGVANLNLDTLLSTAADHERRESEAKR